MTPRPPHRLTVSAGSMPPLAALLLAGLLLAGCQAPAYVLDAVLPDDRIPAAYEIEDRPTVVVVDDPDNALPQSLLRSLIAATVSHRLEREEIVATTTAASRVEELRADAADFDQWAIDRIGRELDAEQVIYVHVERLEVTDPTYSAGPRADVRVKLIDVATGERLFPEDDHGQRVSVRMSFDRSHQESQGTESVVAQNLARKTGEQIARLFYEHKERPVGSGFED